MRAMYRSGAWLAATVGWLAAAPSTAAAQEAQAPVALEWIRLEGAEVCPPKSAFRGALAQRLGTDPFAARAKRVLTVSLSNENGPFRAVLALKDAGAEEPESKQELFSYSSRCDEVFAATVLSVALLLNPADAMQREKPIDEELGSDFFNPAEQPHATGFRPASPTSEQTTEDAPQGGPDTSRPPVAPYPWARRHGYLGMFGVVSLEQLPQAGLGLALRSEFPLARRWLITAQADWLSPQPIDTTSTSAFVSQSSGWLGGAWILHGTERLELWIEAALGLRFMHVSARELLRRDSHVHAATRLGLGSVVHLTSTMAITGVALAAFPFAEESFGAWTQRALGGQVQLGLLVAFPGPASEIGP